MDTPDTLKQLWQLAGNDPDRIATQFDPVGLSFLERPEHFGYPETPRNSVTFAATGGGGVHFGWIESSGSVDQSPIVMTVPMSADCPNIIVGDNLLDFLSLGCRFGYFALEQLAYDFDATVAELEQKRFDPDTWPEKQLCLEQLTQHFNLAPWNNPGQRLRELRDRHFHKLQITTQ